MPFVLIGIVLILLNLFGVGPSAKWNWQFFGDLWKFTVPFFLAVLWWTWSDKTGLNKRREIARMEAKKAKRREQNLAALEIGSKARRDKR